MPIVDPAPKYFTLPNFIKYLESYQPEGKYPYDSNHACVIAHFMQYMNRPEPRLRNIPVEAIKEGEVPRASIHQGKWFRIPEWAIALAKAEPHTYPAILERAKRALANEAEYSEQSAA